MGQEIRHVGHEFHNGNINILSWIGICIARSWNSSDTGKPLARQEIHAVVRCEYLLDLSLADTIYAITTMREWSGNLDDHRHAESGLSFRIVQQWQTVGFQHWLKLSLSDVSGKRFEQ